MRNFFKKTSLLLFVLIVASCGMLTGDKFVYVGHGKNTPDYQLYYDKTRKMFVLIDKRNGCFQKDDTGTCFALTLQQAREFRQKVLVKMIEIDLRLAKDNYGSYAIHELQKAGITTVNKPIKIEDVYATPIRQIVIDRKQQYHLVRQKYKVQANLVAMVMTDDNGEKRIKVAYTVDFPGLEKRYGTELRPFVIDPEYLYTHMTIDTVHEAHYMQKDVLNNQKQVKKEIANYLNDVVDQDQKANAKGDPEENIANEIAAQDSDIVTKSDLKKDKSSSNISSGSSVATAKRLDDEDTDNNTSNSQSSSDSTTSKSTDSNASSSVNSGSSIATNDSEDSGSDFGSVNQKNTAIIGKLDSE
ncbi:FTN_0109 family protein [Francisella uliginis]|uniref:Lipoprotein n=1 Tax=Francisella uliginis TaxID=573570 RepID=A0A1L4BQ08_9GAMM|nr:hypothetical protein [Francisella uliginis]API85931.1 hypothetical protein F7310_00540 [Francisella uliginis]